MSPFKVSDFMHGDVAEPLPMTPAELKAKVKAVFAALAAAQEGRIHRCPA